MEGFIEERQMFKPIQNMDLGSESGAFMQARPVKAEVIDCSAVQPAEGQPLIEKEGRERRMEETRVLEKLEMITNQMDILTQTVAIIEQRLTNTEDKLNSFISHHSLKHQK